MERIALGDEGGGRDGGRERWIAWVWIGHPASRNALSPQMMVQLADIAAAAQTAEAIVLQGEGGTFCSGGNLEAVREHLGRHGQGGVFGAFMQDTVRRLRQRPLYAALEGVAMGGGAELIAACAGVVAAPGARVGFVHAALGVVPGFGGGRWLCGRVGAGRAGRILRHAALMKTEEALQHGLIDRVCDDPGAWLRAHLVAKYGGADLSAADADPGAADADLSADADPGAADAGRSGATALPARALEASVQDGIRRILAAQPLSEADALRAELAAFADLWGGPAHRAALSAPRR